VKLNAGHFLHLQSDQFATDENLLETSYLRLNTYASINMSHVRDARNQKTIMSSFEVAEYRLCYAVCPAAGNRNRRIITNYSLLQTVFKSIDILEVCVIINRS